MMWVAGDPGDGGLAAKGLAAGDATMKRFLKRLGLQRKRRLAGRRR